jgi:hypothetical protein
MKRLLTWLETGLAHVKSLFVADQASDAEDVEPEDDGHEDDGQESAKAAEMPDIYSDVKKTNPHMKVLEAVKADSDDTRGFNPYDTGTLQKKDDD